MLKSIGLLVIAALPVLAQDTGISAERIREHTRFLASDLLEGRGTGTRGGEIAAEYIATQLALAGAKPAGDNGTYYQKVPLVGIETQPGATLSAAVWGKGLDLRWGDDFVGTSQTQRPDTRFRRRSRVRGARDHGAGVQMGRFQRRRRDRQGAGHVHQRTAVHRSEILRRARAHLLRPLGL